MKVKYTWGAWLAVGVFLLLGCASTGKSSKESRWETIPEGKGHLILEAGGIPELDFRIVDQATDDVVVKHVGRGSGWARSPRTYEKSFQESGLQEFVDPGVYKVVVDTDLDRDDPIVIEDVVITAGQRKYIRIPVGRFSVIVTQISGSGDTQTSRKVQMPFTVLDYGLDTVLMTRGMTSTQVKYFVVPVGAYRVKLERRGPRGTDSQQHIKDLAIKFGQVWPVQIELGETTAQPEEGQ